MITEFFIILLFILIGILLRRVKVFPDNTSHVLNLMVIWVALPAVIFLQIPKIHFTIEALVPAFTPWLMIIVFSALTLLFGKLINCERKTIGALLLLVPLGNTSFLGIPMVKTFFTAESIPYAIIYDQLGSFLGLAVYGALVVSIFASGEKLQVKSVLFKMITFPPFVSLILALLLSLYFKNYGTNYPLFIIKILKTLAITLVPMAMIAVGFQLKLKLSKKGYLSLAYGLTAKLIVAPVFLFLLFKTFGIQHHAAQISIFESAMPPMITAGAISISAGLDEDLSASLVGIGLVASFITLPLIYKLIMLL